jgi:hypothetical protein
VLAAFGFGRAFAHRAWAAAWLSFLRSSVPLPAFPPLAPFWDKYSLILGSIMAGNIPEHGLHRR